MILLRGKTCCFYFLDRRLHYMIYTQHLRGGVLMNMDFNEIHSELLVMKQELESRLEHDRSKNVYEEFATENFFRKKQDEKKVIIQKHIQDDLIDVKRALIKLDFGIYGYCEETGKPIPINKLKTLPTARTLQDFTYSELVRM
jgi:RNA polymerase-binding transcription factor DksA